MKRRAFWTRERCRLRKALRKNTDGAHADQDKKIHGIALEQKKTNGECNRIASLTTIKFENSTHPIFYCSSPLGNGRPESKRGTKTMLITAFLTVNQRCICAAVVCWFDGHEMRNKALPSHEREPSTQELTDLVHGRTPREAPTTGDRSAMSETLPRSRLKLDLRQWVDKVNTSQRCHL